MNLYSIERLFLHQLLKNKDELLYLSKYLNYIQESPVELVMALQCFSSCRPNPCSWTWLLSHLSLGKSLTDITHCPSQFLVHTGYINLKAEEALLFMLQQTKSWLPSR